MRSSTAWALTWYIYIYMIHINLNMIFYTHVEYSPTKTIYIKYYKKKIYYEKQQQQIFKCWKKEKKKMKNLTFRTFIGHFQVTSRCAHMLYVDARDSTRG